MVGTAAEGTWEVGLEGCPGARLPGSPSLRQSGFALIPSALRYAGTVSDEGGETVSLRNVSVKKQNHDKFS